MSHITSNNGRFRRLPTAGDVLIDLEALVDFENEDAQDVLTFLDDFHLSPSHRYSRNTRHIIGLNEISYKGHQICPGMAVLLIDGDYLWVQAIAFNIQTDEHALRGDIIRRTRQADGMLERKAQEGFIFREVILDDSRAAEEHRSTVEVPLQTVIKPVELRFTNRKFPHWRAAAAKSRDALTVRWKLTVYYQSEADRTKKKYKEKSIKRISEAEASNGFSISEVALRERWRGTTIAGGSYQPLQSTPHVRGNQQRSGTRAFPITVDSGLAGLASAGSLMRNPIDLTIPTESGMLLSVVPPSPALSRQSVPGQKYTFADAFCSSGGFSRGAKMAGLQVVWGFDFCKVAIEAWKMNFPEATAYCKWADEFCNIGHAMPDEVKVDVLHISPPCQYFSPCHTNPGKNDEMNTASLFSVPELIRTCKPRIVTLEQTFGIERLSRCRQYFSILINMFTSLNFSIRWKLVPLQQYGIPQRRLRLIIVASCPGQSLPQLPAPTHSEHGQGGLKPYTTINQVIGRLQVNARNDPDFKPFHPHQRRPAYDGNTLVNTITCSGPAKASHPSGIRNFTIRELAALQSFPPEHRFMGSTTQKKKQIGNAVPPLFVKTLLGSIVDHLTREDGIVEENHIMRH